MVGCEPGHEWRPERETASFVRFRCADCGSVCVAPQPVEQFCLLDVHGAPRPRRAAAAPRRRAEAPRWASAAPPAPTAG